MVDPQRRRAYVEKLLKKISDRHGGKRPDMIIAAFADVSVYAVRQWLTRGVARHHRQLVANLADMPVEDLERAHGE
jgi:Asp/Glu/hydantoin racemase